MACSVDITGRPSHFSKENGGAMDLWERGGWRKTRRREGREGYNGDVLCERRIKKIRENGYWISLTFINSKLNMNTYMHI